MQNDMNKEAYIKPMVVMKEMPNGLFPVVEAFAAGVAVGKAVGHMLDGRMHHKVPTLVYMKGAVSYDL